MHLFNHKGWILGYLDDDNTSIDVAALRMTSRHVKGVILGDACTQTVEHVYRQEDFYTKIPEIKIPSENDLLGRQDILWFLSKHLDSNP